MTRDTSPDPDPTLQLAERQLALLGELAEMAMAAARAFTASAIASARAEEAILADEHFIPEVGRARACGAKAAAESFQKAARAVRLTLMLEMNLAEIVRDIRAGRVTYLGRIAVRKEVDGDAGAPVASPVLSDDRDRDRRRRDSNSEPLFDIERPDTLRTAPFRDTVEQICGDLDATVHWDHWRLRPRPPMGEPSHPPPPRSPPSNSSARGGRGRYPTVEDPDRRG